MTQELIDSRDLGLKCQEFILSDVGKYLIARADTYNDELLKQFSSVSARDDEAILRLQSLAEVPRLFRKWITEAITTGEEADFQLNAED